MAKEVMIVVGAGQILLAIARRMGYGKQILLGDKSEGNAKAIGKVLEEAGFDVTTTVMDLSDRASIQAMVKKATSMGPVKYLVNGAGVSPSQASIETILKVDLYGTAVLLEEVGKVIEEGGAGIVISSQSGFRMKQLTPEEDRQLALTPTEELLDLPLLAEENIETTPLALDEFNGIRGDFYKNMFAKSPAGRPGTADEVADVAELLMSDRAQFITGATFLVDGGATASYYYGPLQPGLATGMAEGKK